MIIEPLTAVAWAFSTVKTIAQTEQGKKFIDSTIGKTAEKMTEAGLQKIGELRAAIVQKLQGNPVAKAALEKAQVSGSQEDFEDVADYLKIEARKDAAFAQQVQSLVQEIKTLVQFDDVNAENVMQVFDGQGLQVIKPTAPTIQAKDSPITINYNNS